MVRFDRPTSYDNKRENSSRMKLESKREIRAKIDASHTVDSRFSSSVQQHRDRQVNAVLGFLDGKYKPLGEWASRKYKCVILDDPEHTCLYFKLGDPHPVPSGKWMGWPEKHWKISKSKWEQMPLRERAVLECKEQVARYVWRQWLRAFIEFYMPGRYEKAYWNYTSRKRLDSYKPPTLRDLFPKGW
jgi:hypothetical protein